MAKASPPLRWAAPVGGVLLLACLSSGQAQPAVRILARFSVPGAPSLPTDVRWASDSSIFLSRILDGVSELKLAEGLPEVRRVLASGDILGEKPRRLDNRYFQFLGVSEGNVMVASGHRYHSWTSIERPKGGTRSVSRWSGGETVDLDIHEGRFLLLGEPGTHERPWEDGAVAWLGSLDRGPQELQPVLQDSGGPPAWNFANCYHLQVGAVRFLADGSFVIVPGSDPVAHLFDPRGVLKRSWNTARLGLDTAESCSKMPEKEALEYFTSNEKQLAWVNAHRVLDEILPLPQGPGLLIRWRGADGLVHWELKVLGSGGVSTYAIPFTSDRPFDRLRGDARGGRIALLRAAHPWYLASRREQVPAELILAEVPR